MLYAAMPLFLIVVSYLVWGIISCKNADKSIIRVKATSSVVILLFLVHPNLVNYVFNVFK